MTQVRQLLIVGSSSPVARALEANLSADHRVIVSGRRSKNWRIDLSKPTIELRLPPGTDVVINLGFEKPNVFGQSNQSQELETNIAGPMRLFHATENAGIDHFIQISSIFANWDASDIRHTEYSMQKLLADQLLQLAAKSSETTWTSLRPAAIFGPSAVIAKSQPFLHQTLRRLDAGAEIFLDKGGRDYLRNYLHIDDFCEIVRRVVKLSLPGLWDCPGASTSYRELLFAYASHKSKQLRISEPRERIDAEFDLVPNFGSELYQHLAFVPRQNVIDFFS